jgi:hypothetical protein
MLYLVQAFKEALGSLHGFPHVHLIVATRLEAPAPEGVGAVAVVRLSRLDTADGMQLLQSHLRVDAVWTASDQAAAGKLVEVVQGHPLVLCVAGGLVQHGSDLSWQVSNGEAACEHVRAFGQRA